MRCSLALGFRRPSGLGRNGVQRETRRQKEPCQAEELQRVASSRRQRNFLHILFDPLLSSLLLHSQRRRTNQKINPLSRLACLLSLSMMIADNRVKLLRFQGKESAFLSVSFSWSFFFPKNISISLSPLLLLLLLLVIVRVDVLADLLVHREHGDRRREDRLELAFHQDLSLVGRVLEVFGLDVLLSLLVLLKGLFPFF